MKNMNFILKLVAAALALSAAVCCIVAFWDNLRDALDYVKTALPKCCCHGKAEYIDWDEE